MKSEIYWAVVTVESGIPTTVSLFSHEATARKQEQFLRANMNLEDDETGVFEVRRLDIASVGLGSPDQ